MFTFQTFHRLDEKKEDIIKKGNEHGLKAIRIYRSPFVSAENILHFLVDTDEKNRWHWKI